MLLTSPHDRVLLKTQPLSKMQSIGCLFSALHLTWYFGEAVKHTARTAVESFDYVDSSRHANPISTDFSEHLTNFLKLGTQYDLPEIPGHPISFLLSLSTLTRGEYIVSRPPVSESWCWLRKCSIPKSSTIRSTNHFAFSPSSSRRRSNHWCHAEIRPSGTASGISSRWCRSLGKPQTPSIAATSAVSIWPLVHYWIRIQPRLSLCLYF